MADNSDEFVLNVSQQEAGFPAGFEPNHADAQVCDLQFRCAVEFLTCEVDGSLHLRDDAGHRLAQTPPAKRGLQGRTPLAI
jgi:hypothetical protein